MVCSWGYQTIVSEFDSQWVPHTPGFVIKLSLGNVYDFSFYLWAKLVDYREFDSQWVHHISDLEPNETKLSKWRLLLFLSAGKVNRVLFLLSFNGTSTFGVDIP